VYKNVFIFHYREKYMDHSLDKLVNGLRREGKAIVTTNGSFDILHAAHVNLLEKARLEGDYLIVLLNSDYSIKRNKGDKRPIVPQNERKKMLESLKCVDYVTLFDQDKPLDLLRLIKPNVHVKGGSVLSNRVNEEKELLYSWGGEYKQFGLEEGYSTTNIINKILDSY
jgi:rfaE bifunctional protein nucleotidyltransferase chain/domain